MVTISGVKFKTSRTLKAPNNKAVLDYLKAVKEGQKETAKVLKKMKKNISNKTK